MCEEWERDVALPRAVLPHLVLGQAHLLLGGLETLLNRQRVVATLTTSLSAADLGAKTT